MKNLTFNQFKNRILFSMYKRGITLQMMAKLFGVSENYFEEILEGFHKDTKAKKIIQDLILYF